MAILYDGPLPSNKLPSKITLRGKMSNKIIDIKVIMEILIFIKLIFLIVGLAIVKQYFKEK